MERAHQIGAIDRMVMEQMSVLCSDDDSDLLILACPPVAILTMFPMMQTKAVVTDVAGLKASIMQAVPAGLRFVGGHPMAGRETSGPDSASGSLFRGATWVLCPGAADPVALSLVRGMVEDLGAIPVEMSPEDHDRSVAAVSHLPQLLASLLVREVASDREAFSLAAGGFRDLTRVARSDPGLWSDLLVANRTGIEPMIDQLIKGLSEIKELLQKEARSEIEQQLAEAREIRNQLTASVASVGVILEDRPGEMAQVGHALERSGVDLRDLQLRHATHGGGGVLTLSVRQEELPKLTAALGEEGFRLLET